MKPFFKSLVTAFFFLRHRDIRTNDGSGQGILSSSWQQILSSSTDVIRADHKNFFNWASCSSRPKRFCEQWLVGLDVGLLVWLPEYIIFYPQLNFTCCCTCRLSFKKTFCFSFWVASTTNWYLLEQSIGESHVFERVTCAGQVKKRNNHHEATWYAFSFGELILILHQSWRRTFFQLEKT